VSALKQLGLFSIGLVGTIGATWLGKTLYGAPYQFPDGWIVGVAIGLASVIGARFRARTEGVR
jgi:hypothetical protein